MKGNMMVKKIMSLRSRSSPSRLVSLCFLHFDVPMGYLGMMLNKDSIPAIQSSVGSEILHFHNFPCNATVNHTWGTR